MFSMDLQSNDFNNSNTKAKCIKCHRKNIIGKREQFDETTS